MPHVASIAASQSTTNTAIRKTVISQPRSKEEKYELTRLAHIAIAQQFHLNPTNLRFSTAGYGHLQERLKDQDLNLRMSTLKPRISVIKNSYDASWTFPEIAPHHHHKPNEFDANFLSVFILVSSLSINGAVNDRDSGFRLADDVLTNIYGILSRPLDPLPKAASDHSLVHTTNRAAWEDTLRYLCRTKCLTKPGQPTGSLRDFLAQFRPGTHIGALLTLGIEGCTVVNIAAYHHLLKTHFPLRTWTYGASNTCRCRVT